MPPRALSRFAGGSRRWLGHGPMGDGLCFEAAPAKVRLASAKIGEVPPAADGRQGPPGLAVQGIGRKLQGPGGEGTFIQECGKGDGRGWLVVHQWPPGVPGMGILHGLWEMGFCGMVHQARFERASFSLREKPSTVDILMDGPAGRQRSPTNPGKGRPLCQLSYDGILKIDPMGLSMTVGTQNNAFSHFLKYSLFSPCTVNSLCNCHIFFKGV